MLICGGMKGIKALDPIDPIDPMDPMIGNGIPISPMNPPNGSPNMELIMLSMWRICLENWLWTIGEIKRINTFSL